jgi:hypothetical protein
LATIADTSLFDTVGNGFSIATADAIRLGPSSAWELVSLR